MAEGPEEPKALVVSQNNRAVASLRRFLDAFRAAGNPDRIRTLCGDLLSASTELLPGPIKAGLKVIRAIDRYVTSNDRQRIGPSEIIDALETDIDELLDREWVAKEFEEVKRGHDQILTLLARLERETRRSAVYFEIIDFTDERQRHKHFFGREDILAELDAVLQRESGWLVLTGQPGLGKSAIFNEWLRRRERADLPTAFHFIRRGYKNWSDPDVVRANLAAQIEQRFPEQRDSEADSAYRLEQLLHRVSPVLEKCGNKLVLLVDGLDEAMALNDRGNQIQRIFPLEVPERVFVIIGSRPHYSKLNWFGRRSGPSLRLDLDARSESNLNAVRAYWERMRGDLRPPVDDELVNVAVERAGGNLLYTVKLFERWQSPDAERSLKSVPYGFSGMLHEFWERLAELPQDRRRQVHAGLAMLCASREPLPLAVLESLLDWGPGDAEAELLPLVREMLLEEHWHSSPAYRPFHEEFRQLTTMQLPVFTSQSHRTLAKFAAWPLETDGSYFSGWSAGDSFRREYALRHRVAHQVAAEAFDAAAATCMDVNYLTAKAHAEGILEVERDVRLAASNQISPEMERRLKALGGALAASAYWARRYPAALPRLLYNHIISSDEYLKDILIWPEEYAMFPRLRYPLLGAAASRMLQGKHGFTAVAALTDGSVATGNESGLIEIWNIGTGQIIATLNGHSFWVTAISEISNGRIVSAAWDRKLIIWDAVTGRQLLTLEEHDGYINDIAVLPDGRIASASEDGTIRIWDVESRQSTALCGHSAAVTSVSVMPGDRIISASKDRSLRIWNTKQGTCELLLEGHQREVDAVVGLPDGRIISTSAMENTVRLWSDSGQSLAVFNLFITGFSEPVANFLAHSSATAVRVWDTRNMREVASFAGHESYINGVSFLPNGDVVSASRDRTVRVWSVEAGHRSDGRAHYDRIIGLSPMDERHIVSFTSFSLAIWDSKHGQPMSIIRNPQPTVSIALLPGNRVASTHYNNNICIWDCNSSQLISTLRGHSNTVSSAAALPNGRLISGSWDRTLRLWDLENGEMLRVLDGHGSSIGCLHVTSDGRVVSGGNDGSLCVWDESLTMAKTIFHGHNGRVTSILSLPDGRVVSASEDTTLRVWDLETEESVLLSGHSRGITALSVVSENEIASASYDATLRLWDCRTGQSVAILNAHFGSVLALSEALDGRIASASYDRTVRIWNVTNGSLVATLMGDAAFTSIVFIDCTLVCAGDQTGKLWFIELDAGLVPEPRC